MATANEAHSMRHAIEIARQGLGTTSPNPVVGAVVLDADGRFAGEGFHEVAGGPHAEVNALAHAGDAARGGTVVVTLEPCAHEGRTGACVDALLEAGVARVVYAVDDPTPQAGGGAERLRAAGVDVEGGVLAREAEAGNEAWLHAVRTGRPFVFWKYASTLDGRVAAPDGTTRWISGERSRAEVHLLRATVDAVIVGTGTAIADDPELTVRDEDGNRAERQPLRVVVGTRELPPTARLNDRSVADTVFLSGPPEKVVADLFDLGVRSVLLEGGPTLAGAFVRAGLVDEVHAYLAPTLLGGGPEALIADVTTLSDGVRLLVRDIARVGADIKVVARPAPVTPESEGR